MDPPPPCPIFRKTGCPRGEEEEWKCKEHVLPGNSAAHHTDLCSRVQQRGAGLGRREKDLRSQGFRSQAGSGTKAVFPVTLWICVLTTESVVKWRHRVQGAWYMGFAPKLSCATPGKSPLLSGPHTASFVTADNDDIISKVQ